jgi:hypothetical protein
MSSGLDLAGVFVIERLSAEGRVLERRRFANGVTTVGLNHILETEFRGGTPVTAWYAGLIDATNYSALVQSDTMSSHAGWQESSAYNEATRPQWSPGAASAGVVTNGTAMQFTFNAQTTVKGMFIASANAKGGTSGTLWASGLADSDLTYYPGEIARAFYQLTAAAGAGT